MNIVVRRMPRPNYSDGFQTNTQRVYKPVCATDSKLNWKCRIYVARLFNFTHWWFKFLFEAAIETKHV